jgi:hypothetical protein
LTENTVDVLKIFGKEFTDEINSVFLKISFLKLLTVLIPVSSSLSENDVALKGRRSSSMDSLV